MKFTVFILMFLVLATTVLAVGNSSNVSSNAPHWMPPKYESCVYKQYAYPNGTVFKTLVGYNKTNPFTGQSKCFPFTRRGGSSKHSSQTNILASNSTTNGSVVPNGRIVPVNVTTPQEPVVHGQSNLRIKGPWYPKYYPEFVEFVFMCEPTGAPINGKYNWFYGNGRRLLRINNDNTFHRYERLPSDINYTVTCFVDNSTHRTNNATLNINIPGVNNG